MEAPAEANIPNIRVIADDLTGAADTGLAFWRAGLPVQVRFVTAKMPFPVTGYTKETPGRVQVISTETRNGSARNAEVILRNLWQFASCDPASLFFKKIDSTLRGWVGVEICALLDTLPGRIAWIVPSYPKLGRRMEDGVYCVNGIPLADTEFAGEVRDCPADSRIVPFLERQMGESVGFVGREILERGAGAVAAFVNDSTASGQRRAVVFDAASDAHIAQIVAASACVETPPLWVGSAGLAGALTDRLPGEPPPVPVFSPPILASADRPVVVVAGTRNPVTRRQVEYLKTREPLVYHGIMGQLPGGFNEDRSVDVILTPGEVDPFGGRRGPTYIAEQLAIQAVWAIHVAGCRRMILTGGDTAAATCRGLKVEALEIVGLVEEGIPLLCLRGGTADGAMAVTKAGGFGTEESLHRAFKLLQGTNE